MTTFTSPVVARRGQQQRWGRICFIASASVRQPIADLALSNISRTGLWAWTKTAAQDLAEHGITVNVAAPVCMPPTVSSNEESMAARVILVISARSSPFSAPTLPTSSTGLPSALNGGAVTGLL